MSRHLTNICSVEMNGKPYNLIIDCIKEDAKHVAAFDKHLRRRDLREDIGRVFFTRNVEHLANFRIAKSNHPRLANVNVLESRAWDGSVAFSLTVAYRTLLSYSRPRLVGARCNRRWFLQSLRLIAKYVSSVGVWILLRCS